MTRLEDQLRLAFRAKASEVTPPPPPLELQPRPVLDPAARRGSGRFGTPLQQRWLVPLAASVAVLVVVAGALAVGGALPVHRTPPAAPTGSTGTAYVTTNSNTVVPISLATNTVGAPIRVPEVIDDPFVIQAAMRPDGRTVYEVGMNTGATVTPIDTATNTAKPTITIKGAEPQDFALAPDGKTAYLSALDGLFRISTATNRVSKPIVCSRYGCGAMAFTPNGKTLYVIGIATHGARAVTVIRTASNTPLTRITLPVPDNGSSPRYIAITPNGKTAYVVDTIGGAQPGVNSVVPISVATNRPLPPIKIWAPGFSEGLVIAPDGRTAYVLTSSAVTAIDTATNHAEATINLPQSAGNAYSMALAPDGKTLYVLTPRGVFPIRTASGALLPTIAVPHLYTFGVIGITRDSRTIYVGAAFTHRAPGQRWSKFVTGGVVPISAATDTAGRFINVGGEPSAITFAP